MNSKKGNWFFRILTILFMIYLVLYILRTTGYYEKTVREKTIMTETKIRQFEQDVADNKAVDIIDYFPPQKDYSNFFTKTANIINNRLSDAFDENVHSIWDFIKSLFIG